MNGFGRYTFVDGRRYEGQYFNDKKHGYGVYSWPDGRVYKGYWKDGKQHGLGEYSVPSRNGVQKRYGQWEDGARK